jgi:hypothetical protein
VTVRSICVAVSRNAAAVIRYQLSAAPCTIVLTCEQRVLDCTMLLDAANGRRRVLPPRGAGILVLVATSLVSTLAAQTQFDPATAVWRVRATTHFEIYYTRAVDVDSIAREAERGYSSISRELRRQVSAKVPLILLPSTRDLPRTEQQAAVIVRASGAPDRDHLLLAVAPRTGRESRLAHELTHIFEFDRRTRRE